ncbi:hypothetical protein, partial [Bradyrhizobium sp.]|uniref:hypothetical protein n=1 Tax=Bradyrhizobium sp. TaxID=376 RepID=UPI0025BB5B9F
MSNGQPDDLPDGQITVAALIPRPVSFAKIFRFAAAQITFTISAVLSRKRGVGHRHERWGGMRWTRTTLLTRACACGRR